MGITVVLLLDVLLPLVIFIGFVLFICGRERGRQDVLRAQNRVNILPYSSFSFRIGQKSTESKQHAVLMNCQVGNTSKENKFQVIK